MSYARRSASVVFTIALIYSTASSVSLQQAPTPREAAPVQPTPQRVQLIIDEQYARPGAADLARAQVWSLSAATVPVQEWPTLTITEPLHMATLLNSYYDLYALGSGSSPRTVRAMSEAIATANRELVSQSGMISTGTLKVPPIPMRGNTFYDLEEVQSRTFDPRSFTYTATKRAGDIVTLATGTDAPPPVQGNDALRGGKVTNVMIEMTAEVRRTLRAFAETSAPFVALDRDGPAPGVANITLLEARAQPCDTAAMWLPSSPYHPAIKTLFNAADIEKLKQRAALVPLTIIDWNVSTGHGAKVRAVVSQSLRDFGLSELDKPQFVKTFELNPTRNGTKLRDFLDEYRQFLVGDSPDMAGTFNDAKKWVADHKPSDENALNQQVHSLVLQAVFWKHFTQPQALNFSFTTDSAALTVADAKFMKHAKAFGAFAAGNRGLPASLLLKPQAEAMHYRTVVNVTHGRLGGVIDGDTTNLQDNVIVNLVAPGCGYTVSPITATENGSSFASPYVAASAWVRMLQGSTVESLKRSLNAASVPLAVVGPHVESGGLFDPALLFLRPGPHVITDKGEFLLSTELAVKLTYESAAGKIVNIANKPNASATISLHECIGGGVCAMVREFEKDGRVVLTSGPVTEIFLKVVAAGRQIEEATPAAALKAVKLISY